MHGRIHLGPGFLTAMLLAVGTIAQAAEYFVAKTGSDAADGLTATTAFATIAHGVTALKPGDTLTILPGQYFETVTAKVSGTPEAPVTIRAQRPGTVLLRGDLDASGFKLADGRRYTYWTASDRRVEGVADRADLCLYEPVLSVAEVEQNPGVFYQDPETNRLYVHTADSAPPDGKALTVSVTNGFGLLLPQKAHDVVIDGLSFTGYNAREFPPEPGSRNRWGLFVDSSSERITIRRCTAFLNSGGIGLSGPSDAVVEDCYAFANFSLHQGLGNNILAWSGHNTTFRRNTVEDFLPLSPSWSGNGTSRLTFYGGARADGKPPSGLMKNNLVINGGLMIKGAFSADNTFQRGNCVVGTPAYYHRVPDASNLKLPDNEGPTALRTYADPIAHDYRLQSDAPIRGTGPDGSDPGPFPYRDEVFFVSPQGDDANAGTSLALAWKSLAHAAKTAQAGHTVYVTAGVYREALTPAHSGDADNPISFRRRGRDRVVLDGGGELPVGIDLSGRSNIEISGVMVRNFAGTGIRATTGANIRVEQATILGNGAAGVHVRDVQGLAFQRNLLRDNRAGGLRLERSPGAALSGNIFDRNGAAGLSCDTAALEDLWSDLNAFPPAAEPAAALAGKSLRALADWQGASGQDANSVAVAPGYRDPEGGDFGLREDSALIGRGPEARPVGPYLRVPFQAPVRIEHLNARAVTATTATVECWTPTARSAIVLEWGESSQIETPENLTNLAFSPVLFHSVGLAGLKPGTRYTARARAKGAAETYGWAPWAAARDSAAAEPVQAAAITFETRAQDAPPRQLHVAVTGDDRNSGLTPADAWRSIGHAATEARAGDTVLIHAGTYEETVFVRATGDTDRPITFRAAPDATVWIDGSDRARATGFRIQDKHSIHLDGLRFRHFNCVAHTGGCINIANGSGHVVRRCFYDGRELSGYTDIFLRGRNTTDLLVENCVMINGMGVGVSLDYCVNATVQHCVFYNNFIRALDVIQWYLPPWQPRLTVTFSHNLVCDTIPQKIRNPLLRVSHLDALTSDHNGYFTRIGPAERLIVESTFYRNKPFGSADGKYGYWSNPARLLLAEVQELTGQEQHSVFGNPGMRVVKELEPSGRQSAAWKRNEMHQEGTVLKPLDFADFFCDPDGPMATAADDRPLGLDPAAFRNP